MLIRYLVQRVSAYQVLGTACICLSGTWYSVYLYVSGTPRFVPPYTVFRLNTIFAFETEIFVTCNKTNISVSHLPYSRVRNRLQFGTLNDFIFDPHFMRINLQGLVPLQPLHSLISLLHVPQNFSRRQLSALFPSEAAMLSNCGCG
jgi:hypothetical protein